MATCGLCCEICLGNRPDIQQGALLLHKTLEDPMYWFVLEMTTQSRFEPGEQETISRFLETIGAMPPCPGCEGRGDCAINSCARGLDVLNCSECTAFDPETGLCTAPPVPVAGSPMPPPAIYFSILKKRYKGWNVENLRLMRDGNGPAFQERIQELQAAGKTSGDLLDKTVSFFDDPP